MAKTDPASSQPLVTELNVSANIMAMEPGLYCIFHADNAAVDAVTGLPGVRITPPPGRADPLLEIRTFGEGGWLGGAAAMVQTQRAASVLVTVYRDAHAATQGPQLQVVRLGDAARPVEAAIGGPGPARPAPPAAPQAASPPEPAPAAPAAAQAPNQTPAPSVSREEAEVAAHIQRRGDTLAKIGEWMGAPGSQQWIEGFAIAPRGAIGVKDVEYQAVLGRGWLSPWSEGGQFCGSRGMALPILGLRVRLKGGFAASHAVELEASFTDGTRIGPVDAEAPIEAPSLAPLEAFRLRFVAAEAEQGAAETGRAELLEQPRSVGAPRKASGGTAQAKTRGKVAADAGAKAGAKAGGKPAARPVAVPVSPPPAVKAGRKAPTRSRR